MRVHSDIPADVISLRRELVASGLDDYDIARLVRGGALHRIRHGAYVERSYWESLDEVDRHRVTARAVLRTASPKSILSHVSAALEVGAPVWGIDRTWVHLSRHHRHSGRRHAGVVHHRGSLSPDDVMLHKGVPLTTPVRTAVDMTMLAPVEQALVTVNWLMSRHGVTAESMREVSSRTDQWPNSASTRLVLHLADARNAWPGEARLSYHLWRNHLHSIFTPQVEVFDEWGMLVAKVDFAAPEHGVFLEFDGRIKYDRTWRDDDKSVRDVLYDEKMREELIVKLTGWTCIRVTWDELRNPELLCQRIRQVIASRWRHQDSATHS